MIVLPHILLTRYAIHVIELAGYGRHMFRNKAVPFGCGIYKAGEVIVSNQIIVFVHYCYAICFDRILTVSFVIPNHKGIAAIFRTVSRYSQKIDSGCCCE